MYLHSQLLNIWYRFASFKRSQQSGSELAVSDIHKVYMYQVLIVVQCYGFSARLESTPSSQDSIGFLQRNPRGFLAFSNMDLMNSSKYDKMFSQKINNEEIMERFRKFKFKNELMLLINSYFRITFPTQLFFCPFPTCPVICLPN